MNNIVVYCGSNLGEDPCYSQAARELGRTIAERGSRLVYGGGGIGLMGEVASAALAAGGQVTGIIPTANDTAAKVEVARFTVDGKRISAPVKGINIVKYADGTVRKVIVR